MKRKPIILLAAILIVWLAKSYIPAILGFRHDEIRYKVTISVETPEGLKSASAVRIASSYTEPSILPEQGGTVYGIKKGEAVVLDLQNRGTLFALLGGEDEARLIFRLFHVQKQHGVIDLKSAQYPMFVHFHDPADPKTVEALLEIKPCGVETPAQYRARCVTKDRFAEAFGEGVILESVSIERTDEAPELGKVNKYLPWTSKVKGYIDGQLSGGGPELSNILDVGYFIKGQK